MNLDTVEKLVDLVAAANVREVSVREGGVRVTVRKGDWPAPQPGVAEPASLAPAPADEDAASPAPEVDLGLAIESPMVGVFHQASPAVQAGWSIKAGQVVGVIESMKLLSDVRAAQGGIVRAVLVDEGMAVEFGQPLFELAPPNAQ